MKTDQADKNESRWIIVRIDGKIASVSTDYRQLASITARLAGTTGADAKAYKELSASTETICADTVSFNEIWKLKKTVRWEDFILLGTDFQKSVWKKLWELTHPTDPAAEKRLLSYTDFAELCDNRAGVRAVAHAIGLNPLPALIPCHLVVPKETVDRILDIQKKAESTIFKGDDLCLGSILQDRATNFGEYALGKALKRKFINLEFNISE
jgi:O-6-methylguanine DNA methyltransferase